MNNDTLELGEIHPMAPSAYRYIKDMLTIYPSFIEAIASTALSGNRASEICMGTLDRIRNNEMVSDRYVLGLAWLFKELEERNKIELLRIS